MVDVPTDLNNLKTRLGDLDVGNFQNCSYRLRKTK